MIVEAIVTDGGCTKGKRYAVLEIFINPTRNKTFYRIIPDEGGSEPLMEMEQFKVVDNHIPSNWIVYVHQGEDGTVSHIEMTPAAWARKGFMEDYFNWEPEAERIFHEERDKILAECGMLVKENDGEK